MSTTTEAGTTGQSAQVEIIEVDQGLVPTPGPQGEPGSDGKSAYELAVERGFVGDVDAWLGSLEGSPGKDGADGKPGNDGKDGKDGEPGQDGESAFEIALTNGFIGTEADWLESLRGRDGKDGIKGDKGDIGPAGADVVVDYDLIRSMIQEMIDEINAGNGGTEEPGENDGSSGGNAELVTSRWNTNSLASPYTPVGDAVGHDVTLTITGSGAALASDGNLILNKGTYLRSPEVALDFPVDADPTKTGASAVFRASFKGVVPPPVNSTKLFDLMAYGEGQFTMSANWTGTNLVFGWGRNGAEEIILSDDCDMKHDANTLYEVEWTNDVSGAGGTVCFYINGVQAGAEKTTTGKPFFPADIELNVNASFDNTGDGVDGLEVEYVELSYLAEAVE